MRRTAKKPFYHPLPAFPFFPFSLLNETAEGALPRDEETLYEQNGLTSVQLSPRASYFRLSSPSPYSHG